VFLLRYKLELIYSAIIDSCTSVLVREVHKAILLVSTIRIYSVIAFYSVIE